MKIYHVTIYTTDGGQRRLYFPNYENAIDWALSEKSEMDDVDEALDSLPDGIRDGERGEAMQENIDDLENVSYELETLSDSVQEQIDAVQEVIDR